MILRFRYDRKSELIIFPIVTRPSIGVAAEKDAATVYPPQAGLSPPKAGEFRRVLPQTRRAGFPAGARDTGGAFFWFVFLCGQENEQSKYLEEMVGEEKVRSERGGLDDCSHRDHYRWCFDFGSNPDVNFPIKEKTWAQSPGVKVFARPLTPQTPGPLNPLS
jgi:hypothetical protein